MNVEDMVQPLSDAVLRAGAAILDVREAGFETRRKADASPVTAADLAAERVLLEALGRVAPDILVISEERAEREGAPEAAAAPERFFLVDPLDGTKEFVSGRDEFTVNIALIEGGRPVLGFVGAPALGRLFVGMRGAAHVREASGASHAVKTRKWPVKERPRAVASRSHADDRTKALLTSLDAETVSAGSSLKFCRIAEGAADLYPRFGPTMGWDTAAGQAVLEAAGGRVSHLDGRALTYPSNPSDGWRNPGFLAFGACGDDVLARIVALAAANGSLDEAKRL